MKFIIAALTASVVSAVGISEYATENSNVEIDNSEFTYGAETDLESSTAFDKLDEETQIALASALHEPENMDMASEVLMALDSGELTPEQWAWLDKLKKKWACGKKCWGYAPTFWEKTKCIGACVLETCYTDPKKVKHCYKA